MTAPLISVELLDSGDALEVPEQVLQHRLHPRRNGSIPQLLIKWSCLYECLATWEEVVAIQQSFPDAPAWGHVGSRGGGRMSAHLM